MQDIIHKFKFKSTGIVIHAPKDIEEGMIKMGFNNQFTESKSTNTLVFFVSKAELVHFLSSDLKQIESDSVLWFAYPKGTSKMKTDINRDIIRTTAEEYDITTVTAISIDDTWSALRFRPIEKVGK